MEVREQSSTDRQLIRNAIALLLLQVIERGAQRGEQGREARRERVRGRILEINVDTVEAVVLDHADGAGDERRAFGRIRHEVEVTRLRVRPPADREEDLQVPAVMMVMRRWKASLLEGDSTYS